MNMETAAERLYEIMESRLIKEAALHRESISPEKTPFLIAVDGRCGAGKTTFAAFLQEKFGWSVLHMDHFFLRPEQRTKERLGTPGGNIDYERFLEEVLNPLEKGVREIVYRPFDCHRQEMAEPVSIVPAKVCLAEGSYSCHPALWERYDYHVFLTIDREEQMRRIVRRNGNENAEIFRERWIPMEERYFAQCRVEERCELCLAIEE